MELDESNFDKVINKFEASLIKFDIPIPFGEKHKAFVAFAKESIDQKDLIIADVLVKDNGDKNNEALAKKYGATRKNLPVIKLFINGKSEAITFGGKGFTSDELRKFVRENTGLYLSLPGCLEEFDKLTTQFMKGKKDVRKIVLKKTEDLLNGSGKSSSGKIYATVMEKILEKGDDFIQSELERMKKLLRGQVSDEVKKQLGTRINILQTFQGLDEHGKVAKEDL